MMITCHYVDRKFCFHASYGHLLDVLWAVQPLIDSNCNLNEGTSAQVTLSPLDYCLAFKGCVSDRISNLAFFFICIVWFILFLFSFDSQAHFGRLTAEQLSHHLND